eukprot:5313563-Pyramimonas_sp.AAC.1
MPFSKTLEKQLGTRKCKPGRRELEEREIPKNLKEALDEAKKQKLRSSARSRPGDCRGMRRRCRRD